jgi:hypothetical protein
VRLPLTAYCAHLVCVLLMRCDGLDRVLHPSLRLPAPVVVGWGSFHRNRLSALTHEIHCAPSCALSGNCSLYAALLEWRSWLKVAHTHIFGPAQFACDTPPTVLGACLQAVPADLANINYCFPPVLVGLCFQLHWCLHPALLVWQE